MGEHQQRRFFITPIQWMVASVAVVVVLALVFSVIRAEPRPDRIYEWFFPTNTGSFWGSTHPAQTVLLAAPSSATNVSRFYRQALKMPLGAGTIFMGRRSGFLFARRFEEMAAVATIRAGRATNLTSELLLQYKRGQSKLILCSQFDGEPATFVWIASVENKERPVVPLNAFLWAIEFPGSTRGSGGSLQHGASHAYTAATNLAAVELFYMRNFGTNAGKTSAKSNALQTVGDSSAQLYRLPSAPARSTNQFSFLLLTPKTMSLIHAAAVNSNTTHITIGTVAR